MITRAFLTSLLSVFLFSFTCLLNYSPAWGQGKPDLVWMRPGNGFAVSALTYSPDGKRLLYGNGRVVRLSDGMLLNTTFGGGNPIFVTPDNKTTIGINGLRITLTALSDFHEIATYRHTDGIILSAALAPNGQILAAGTKDGKVQLWDLKTGTYRSWQAHAGPVYSVSISHDGTIVASGSGKASEGADYLIKFWSVEKGQLKGSFNGPGKVDRYQPGGYELAFTPDDARIFVAVKDTITIYLYDVATGTVIRRYQPDVNHGFPTLRRTVLSPDGSRLFTTASFGSNSGTQVTLIRTSDGTEVSTSRGGISDIVPAFAPNGMTVALGGNDGFFPNGIAFLRTSDGVVTGTLSPGEVGGNILPIRISPDGQLVYTSCGGTEVV